MIPAWINAWGLKALGAAGAAFAVLAVLMGAREAGRDAERARQRKAVIERVEKARDVKATVDRRSEDDVRQRLRNRWTRDGGDE